MWAGADIKKTTEGGEQQRCMNENPIYHYFHMHIGPYTSILAQPKWI